MTKKEILNKFLEELTKKQLNPKPITIIGSPEFIEQVHKALEEYASKNNIKYK